MGVFTSNPRGFHTNSYWIEGPDGVAVIDTQFMPSQARRLLAAIERETDEPIELAIVLHPNPDKFNGTNVLRERGIPVVTSSQVLARVPEVDALRREWFYDRYAPDYPSEPPRLEAFGSETRDIEVAGLRLTLHTLGPGASDAHVVVEWEGHLFVGDLIANGSHAWLELGLLDAWLARLDELEALDPSWVHPGRGPSGGAELIDAQRTYLHTVREIVRAADPRLPVDPDAVAAIRASIEAEYPDHGYPVFLRVGLPAVYEAEARGGSSGDDPATGDEGASNGESPSGDGSGG